MLAFMSTFEENTNFEITSLPLNKRSSMYFVCVCTDLKNMCMHKIWNLIDRHTHLWSKVPAEFEVWHFIPGDSIWALAQSIELCFQVAIIDSFIETTILFSLYMNKRITFWGFCFKWRLCALLKFFTFPNSRLMGKRIIENVFNMKLSCDL